MAMTEASKTFERDFYIWLNRLNITSYITMFHTIDDPSLESCMSVDGTILRVGYNPETVSSTAALHEALHVLMDPMDHPLEEDIVERLETCITKL